MVKDRKEKGKTNGNAYKKKEKTKKLISARNRKVNKDFKIM